MFNFMYFKCILQEFFQDEILKNRTSLNVKEIDHKSRFILFVLILVVDDILTPLCEEKAIGIIHAVVDRRTLRVEEHFFVSSQIEHPIIYQRLRVFL